MKISLSCLVFLLLFQAVSSRGGGGRGGGGGGRGSSGARSSSSFSSSSSSSSSRSYGASGSSYSKPATSSYRSGNAQYNTNFRTTVFHTTTTSTFFTYSPLYHSHVIISPVTPLYFGGYNYYWGGHYVVQQERPHQCDYTITDEDQELKNVTFSNGTRPTTISFGCKSSESCCGMECCKGSSYFLTVIVALVGFIILVIAFVYCFKNGYCENETVVHTVDIPVITTTTVTGHTPSYGPTRYMPTAPPPPAFEQPNQGYQHFGNPSPYDLRPTSSSHVHTTIFKQ